ncbi:MAG TPA: hypothetical protein VK609_22260 [Mucilaginibacter sp.]|nr:hypothetical protein [Mucilaginibacter sp.]
MSKIQDYKGLKPEQYQQLLIEKDNQLEQLAARREEQQKEIAELLARKAYSDEIKSKK